MAVEIKEVPGLYLVKNVISKNDQKYIIRALITNEGKECKQIHAAREFGWSFLKGYAKSYTANDYLQLPMWSKNIWKKIMEKGNLKDIIGNIETIDNILINIYEKGDFLRQHVDDVNFWNEWVVGFSMGSDIVMDFGKIGTSEIHKIKIPALSAYILTKDARYLYTHSIEPQKFNKIRRISVTFRTISKKYLSDETRKIISNEQL